MSGCQYCGYPVTEHLYTNVIRPIKRCYYLSSIQTLLRSLRTILCAYTIPLSFVLKLPSAARKTSLSVVSHEYDVLSPVNSCSVINSSVRTSVSSSQHWVLRHCLHPVRVFNRPNEHRNAPLRGSQKIIYSFTRYDRLVA